MVAFWQTSAHRPDKELTPNSCIEADESDGSFLVYPSSIGLITNIDSDHRDHYGSDDAFDDAFVAFANGCREVVVVSGDDPTLVRLMPRITAPTVTFRRIVGS